MRVFILFLIFCAQYLTAETFDDVMVYPSAVARGNSFTAVADDAANIIYNPAGLVNIYSTLIEFNYSNLLGVDAIDYYYFAFVVPFIWKGGIGFAWNHQSLNSALPIGEFKEEKFYFSYGINILQYLSVGYSLKYYYAKYDENKTSTISSDIGILFNFEKIRMGMIFKDFYSPQMEWYSGAKESIKKSLRIGLGFFIFNNFNISYDIENLFDKRQKNYIGCEVLLFKKKLSIKSGLIELYLNKFSITGGLSYRTDYFDFKYAFIQHYDLGLSNIFGISLKL